MQQSVDVVVIGGGVIGCAVAYELARRGMQVTVLEQGEIGMQASSAATGLLAPYKLLGKRDDAYLTLLRASLALFPEMVARLETESGLNVEYQESGCVRLAQHERIDRLREWATGWSQAGISMQVIEGEDLAAFEPALDKRHQTAVYISGEPQVRASRFVQAYAQACRQSGVTLRSGCSVVEVERAGTRVSAVQTSQGERFACGQVVLATGAWSGLLGVLLQLEIPVRPARGESFLIAQPNVPVQHIVFGEGIYLAPRKGDQIVVGATHEDAGFSTEVSEAGIAKLFGAACRLVPGLVECTPSHAWAGLRPATPDRRPVLGLAPGWKNVALATGHNGFGVLLSVVTGQVIADVVTDGTVSELIGSFSLERFQLGASSAA